MVTQADLKQMLLAAVAHQAHAAEIERVISCLRGLEVPKVVREWLTEELHLARVSVPAAPKHEALRALVVANKARLLNRACALRRRVMEEWTPEGLVTEIQV